MDTKENTMQEKPHFWKRVLSYFYEREKTLHHTFNRVGGLRIHEISDPALSRQIFKSHQNFPMPSFVRKAVGQLINKALILDEGESWSNVHGLMKDIFSPTGVGHNVAPAIIQGCETMVDRWLAEKKPIDIETEMRRLTATSLMQVMFGPSVTEKQGLAIIDAATVDLNVHKVSPMTLISRIFGSPKDSIVTPHKGLKAAREKVDDIFDEILAKRRLLDTQPPDVLGRLLGATDIASGKPMTDQQIKDQLRMFIFAGHETTSVALTFTVQELLKHPEELAKIRREIDAVAKGGHIRPEDSKNLPHCLNAFKESLRLHPPAYRIVREPLADQVINNVHFEKGDIIRIDVQEMHRSEDLWPNARQFTPDRFHGNPFPEAWMPFGGGARVCLGMAMAITEGTLALAEIFNRATFNVVQDIKGERLGFTLRPAGHLIVTATARTPTAG
jgi:cytochrome P450